MIEIIQVNISGEDNPGITASLTGILARYDAFILDIGQSNIHKSLTMGILFRTMVYGQSDDKGCPGGWPLCCL